MLRSIYALRMRRSLFEPDLLDQLVPEEDKGQKVHIRVCKRHIFKSVCYIYHSLWEAAKKSSSLNGRAIKKGGGEAFGH